MFAPQRPEERAFAPTPPGGLFENGQFGGVTAFGFTGTGYELHNFGSGDRRR
jgi:hypothetical protein